MSYQENILQAVDMVVSQRLNEMSFDKTIVCKVEDDTNASKGEYTVSYQAMTMVVYAANPEEEYKKGQQVYVTVPQGDFNLRKIIIGYVSPSEIPTYLYTNPMKYLVRLSDNLIADTVVLNTENSSAAAINKSIVLRDYSKEGNMPPIKYLCFAADFFTSGEIDYTKKYGIKITGEGTLKEDKTKEKIEWIFDSTQFQGNPYAFNGLFRQEQLFDIERFSELNNLTIELFKEDGNFSITVSNIELIYGYAEEDLTKENIYDKIILYETNKNETYPQYGTNWQLNFATQIYEDQQIKQPSEYYYKWFIYDQQANDVGNGRFWARILKNYDGDSSSSTIQQIDFVETSQQTLILNLNSELDLQFADDNHFVKIIFPTRENEENTKKAVQIMVQVWKRSKVMKYDENTGTYIKLLENPQDYDLDNQPYTTATTNYNKAVEDAGKIEDVIEKQKALEQALENYNKALCEIDAEEKFATSNNLVIRRQDQEDIEGALAGSGIELTVADGGSYYIYDANSSEMIKDLKPAEANMKITAKLTGAAKWIEGSTIVWKIPINSSMIVSPIKTVIDSKANTTYTVWNEDYLQEEDQYETKKIGDITYKLVPETNRDLAEDNYQIITRAIVDNTIPYQAYRISEFYNANSNTNHMIKCEVLPPENYPEEDKEEWEVHDAILLNFGVKGSQGTEYTVAINLNVPYITIADGQIQGEEVIATAVFKDSSGKEIELSNEQQNFYWSWNSKNIDGTDDFIFKLTDNNDSAIDRYEISEVSSNDINEDNIIIAENTYYIYQYGNYILVKEENSNTSYDSTQIYYKQYSNSIVGNICKIKINDQLTTAYDYTKYNGVLSATLYNWQLSNGQNITFKAFIPVPIYYSSDVPTSNLTLQGPINIVYSYKGEDPQYLKNTPYDLKGTIGSEEARESIAVQQIIPSISNTNVNFELSQDKKLLVPYLAPSKLPKLTINFEFTSTGGAKCYYYQPLVIMLNQYSSALINSWGGKLIVDEKNNYILTKLIGAGQKNDRNQFSGVLMGAVGKETEDGITGLYGYQDGELRFKFTENGEAYIGTGSDNMLSFSTTYVPYTIKNFNADGKEEFVKSGNNWKIVTKTSSLRGLFIKTNNFYLDTEKLLINSLASGKTPVIRFGEYKNLNDITKTPYFNSKFQLNADGTATIGGWELTEYSLYKSPDNNATGIGFASTPHAGDPAFWAGYSHATALSPYGDDDWKNNTKFYVTNDGKLRAKEATIEGIVTANSGKIGQFDLKNGKLVGNSIYTSAGKQLGTITGLNAEHHNNSGNNIFLWTGVNVNTTMTKNNIIEAFLHENWQQDPNNISKGYGSIDGTAVQQYITKNASFYVTHTGKMVARDAEITGTLKAGSIIGGSTPITQVSEFKNVDVQITTMNIEYTFKSTAIQKNNVSGILTRSYDEISNTTVFSFITAYGIFTGASKGDVSFANGLIYNSNKYWVAKGGWFLHLYIDI